VFENILDWAISSQASKFEIKIWRRSNDYPIWE